MAGEAVGVGKEVALKGVRRCRSRLSPFGDELGVLAGGGEKGLARAETGGLNCLGDVEDVVALGDGEGAGIDVAANDAVVDLGDGGGMVEAVLASLERAATKLTEQVEAEPVANDAIPLQLLGDSLGSRARSDVDEGLSLGAEGGIDDVTGDGRGDESEQKQEPKKLQNCVPPSGPARCIGLPTFYDHWIGAENTDKAPEYVLLSVLFHDSPWPLSGLPTHPVSARIV